MKRRICYFVLATLQIITWHFVTSRPFAPHDSPPPKEPIQDVPHVGSERQQFKGLKSIGGEIYGNQQASRGLSRLGSRPPNCQHRCQGCIPCNPIQTPATTDRKAVQYTNYEPEGWKCKCGTAFFNP
ncbi:hypothetical protein Tsubulata_003234 [Turnera subulata]|uniref:Epidermal patterning factor-like protein n=1 Tax=Turnera subulata TaxID=218843 RepID=A0A9Q0GIV4_9ROSI|nr:hypothetical protein Tsubulata_003234 [Turnera subulata]